MLKTIFITTLISFLLVGCGSDAEDLTQKKAIGGARYGGEFSFMSKEKITNLLPLLATDIHTQRITTQMFETLLKMDPSGEKVIPGLAESFDVSNGGKTYTFKIRKGIFFHDNECFGGDGKELTADDCKFTLDMACSGMENLNQSSHNIVPYVVGGKDFFEKSKSSLPKNGVSGIRVLDANTLQINLEQPLAGFTKIMTFSGFGIFPQEAYAEYGKELGQNPVGTGPFKLATFSDTEIVLARNDNYWRKDTEFGNDLPYLGGIRMIYSKDKKDELVAFRNSKIDLVLNIPVDQVENILGSLQEAQDGKTVEHKVEALQSNSVTFVGLYHKSKWFADKKVRKAFALAINTEELVNKDLLGEGYPVLNGFIPPTESYTSERIKGNKYDVNAAKSLLSNAGYPNGEGIPELTIIVAGAKGTKSVLLAQGVASQLKANLNINTKVKITSSQERNKLVENGKADIWISGWVADYPDPENFMTLFYGKNAKKKSAFVNAFKYVNSAFDMLYEKANRELNDKKRLDLLVKCDQMIIDDAVVIPLINDDFITMVNSRARNFGTNSLEILDFSSIFIKESSKESK